MFAEDLIDLLPLFIVFCFSHILRRAIRTK